jgi:rhomboid protease GluP
MVGISTLSVFLRGWRSSFGPRRGWIAISGLVLLAMAIAAPFDLDLAGYVGTLLWVPLIFFPGIGSRWIERWCLKQQFERARRVALLLRWLHPADGFWELPEILKVLSQGEQGSLSREEVLEAARKSQSPVARAALVYLIANHGYWEDLLEWTQKFCRHPEEARDPVLVTMRVRAFGETGRISDLVAEYRAGEPYLESFGSLMKDTCRLFLFAFCGETRATADLLNGPLRDYPETTQRFWQATAEMAAGNSAQGFSELLALQGIADRRFSRSLQRRLTQPPLPAHERLTETEWAWVQDAVHQAQREARAEPLSEGRMRLGRPYVTWTLIAINCFMFALEGFFGGTTDDQVLYVLGGLWPDAVIEGHEYWRLLSAAFLHFGTIHIFMNMLALYFVGPFVESALGRVRFLFGYLFSAVGSMLTVTLLSHQGILPPQFLVGASGAITGTIGMTGAIFLRSWRVQRSSAAFQRLRAIGMAILLQTAFDLSTRQVSFTAHISGALLGFLVASCLRHRPLLPSGQPVN